MTLTTVILFAKDMGKMRSFYRDHLGLRVEEDEDGWTKLNAGGCAVALHAIPERYAVDIHISDPPEPRSDTPLKI